MTANAPLSAPHLLSPADAARTLTELTGHQVRPDTVRDWLRRGRTPAGPIAPDATVGGRACLTGDTVTALAASLDRIGWQPARRGRPAGHVTALPRLRPDRLIDVLAVYGLLAALTPADPHVTVSWPQRQATLRSTRPASELLRHLTGAWTPTPAVSPWLAGSGFGVGWDPRGRLKTSRRRSPAHEEIAASTGALLEPWRRAIDVSRGLADGAQAGRWSKPDMIIAARRRLPDPAVRWVDACAQVIDARVHYAPMTGGTGGNIGSADLGMLTARYLLAALDQDPAAWWADATGLPGAPRPMQEGSGGHLDAGGLIDPWTWVLAIEGICLWAPTPACASVAARHGNRVVYPRQAVAYGGDVWFARDVERSAAPPTAAEPNKGEVWLPLPATPWVAADVETARTRWPWIHNATDDQPARSRVEIIEGNDLGADLAGWGMPKRNGQNPIAVHIGYAPKR